MESKKDMFVGVYVLVAQSCPTLCDPMDCSPPGSSVHGILQARILEWVAISFSRGSSQPRDKTLYPTLQAVSLPSELSGKNGVDGSTGKAEIDTDIENTQEESKEMGGTGRSD